MPRADSSLKARLLDLLDRDKEFRYAVAGKLGLSEVLERLDRHEEAIKKLWEEVRALREETRKLWEGQEKLWEEFRALREGQDELRKNYEELRKGQEELRRDYEELKEGQDELREEVRALKEGQEELRRDYEELKEGQDELRRDYERMARDLRDVKVTLGRLTATEEEESREVISYRLRREMGVSIELTSVSVDDREIDLYGASGDLCVVGEATVRLGRGLVEELDEKVELLRRARPDLLRPRVLKVIYTITATPEALEEARGRGVWVLRIDRDLVPRPNV